MEIFGAGECGYEPCGETLEDRVEQCVLAQLDLTREVENEEVYRLIDSAMNQVLNGRYVPLGEKMRARERVFDSMRGLDVLTPLLADESITEIMVNGYNRIFVERCGVIERSAAAFRSKEKYHNIIQQIVADCNRTVNESEPIVDARLLDGSRVNVVLEPISLDGATLTIRKFPTRAMTMEQLIAYGSLGEPVAQLLKLLVESGYNIVISGGTGSGKTTFLNALSNYIPKNERIITIEDSAELRLEGVANLVRMEVRNANVEGNHAVTMKDLIRSSLRMRPDRIIVGEVRGAEALDMLQAFNTGHDGSISTGHANSARDMLTRLETMVLMGLDIPVAALRGQIASALEIIVHLGRLRDHSRRVLEIVEVLGMEDGEIVCVPLFEFLETGSSAEPDRRDTMKGTVFLEGNENIQADGTSKHVRVQGQLIFRHRLKQVAKLMEAGYYDKFCEMLSRMHWQEGVCEELDV